MDILFLKLLNMSISAGWLILVILLLRVFLKKAPKWVNCVLWAFAAFRLVCPFSFESVFSLVPSAETVPPEIMMQEAPKINTGFVTVNHAVNPVISESFAPTPGASVNPLQIYVWLAANVWVLGVLVMLCYAAGSFLLLRKKVRAGVPFAEADKVWLSDNIDTPFILGIFRPRIYLPSYLREEQIPHVLAHENAHLKRRDHWWKPFGFVLLSVYWYNPLVWISYVLLCRDIELACDERVIKELDMEDKKSYSKALLSCSVSRSRIAACPLAFGEVGVKERIKTVLNYKKPAFWVVVTAVIVCTAAAVCFLTNPESSGNGSALRCVEGIGGPREAAYEINNNEDIKGVVLYIEGWQDGVCTDYTVAQWKSPVAKIVIRSQMEQGEEGFTGCDVQAEVLAASSSVISYHHDAPEDLVYMGASYDGYTDGKKKKTPIEAGKEYILAVVNMDCGHGIRTSWNCEQLTEHAETFREPEALVVVRAIFLEEEPDSTNFQDIRKGLPVSEQSEVMEVTDGGLVQDEVIVPGQQEKVVVPEETSLEKAISEAILEHHVGRYIDLHPTDFPCESHVILGTHDYMRYDEETESATGAIDVYLMVLYQQYNMYDNELVETAGSHCPAVLSFDGDGNGGYILKNYWEPRDGAYYAPDIKKKFDIISKEAVENALDNEKYIEDQKKECEDKARAYFAMEGNAKTNLARWFGSIEKGPHSASLTASSAPADYIKEHQNLYDTIVACGEDTLRYCFEEFLSGEQTGLKGQLMKTACQDIIRGMEEIARHDVEYATGQDWFDAFREGAWKFYDRYAAEDNLEDLEKFYPAEWLLLNMETTGIAEDTGDFRDGPPSISEFQNMAEGEKIVARNVKVDAQGGIINLQAGIEDAIFEKLENLEYHDKACDGLPELELKKGGKEYSVNLTEGWVWRNNGKEEADLLEDLIEELKMLLIMK